MTRETKVGLLVGMGVILLIGIIVSDHLAVMQQERRDISDFADRAQDSIQVPGDGLGPDMAPNSGSDMARQPERGSNPRDPQRNRAAPSRNPSVEQRDMERWTPDLDFGPSPTPARPTDRTVNRDYLPQAYALDDVSRDAPEPPADVDGGSASRNAEPTAAEQREPEPITHRVQANETLFEIAEHYYGDGAYWRTIAEQNADRIIDGEHVREGVELTIPNYAGMVNGSDDNGGDAQTLAVVDRANRALRGTSGDSAPAATIDVVSGETLSSLAAEHLGSSGRWRELLEANRDKLETAMDLRAGMKLRLPAAAAGNGSTPRRTTGRDTSTYTVRRGDTLTRIAERELGDGSRWHELYEANRDRLDSPDRLPVGEQLQLPG